MFGSSFGDLASRRVEPPDPSFADEFNAQDYAVLVFGVRLAAVSLPSQVHRLQVLVGAGLIVFPNAFFEFADEGPEEAQHGSLTNLPPQKIQPSPWPFKGCCYEVVRVGASSLPLSVAILGSSQPPRTNPVVHAGAWSAVPLRPQWKTWR